MKMIRLQRQQTLVTLSIITTIIVVASVLMILLSAPSSYITILGHQLLLVAGAFGLAGILITVFLAVTDRVAHR